MKDWICDGCGEDTEVDNDYEPLGCCDGRECGCCGKMINPVFCDACSDEIFGKELI